MWERMGRVERMKEGEGVAVEQRHSSPMVVLLAAVEEVGLLSKAPGYRGVVVEAARLL